MCETSMDNLAIIIADYDKALIIRDELRALDLFERLSFDIGRMVYVIYLKPVRSNDYNKLASLVNTNKYRVFKYY